jgi:hypothetical protein
VRFAAGFYFFHLCIRPRCVFFVRAQLDVRRRWRRLRVHWLRAAVALSTGAAEVVSAGMDNLCALLLRDARLRGCDDGEGHPLRYLSWYGGRVAAML